MPSVYVAHPLLWLLVFIGAVFAIQIVGAVRRSRARRTVVAALGFREVPWAEVFPAESTAGAELFDLYAYNLQKYEPGIFKPVALGTSTLGEVALFDFMFRGAHNRADATVLALRVPRALPDFTLHHALLGDRITQWLSEKAGAPPDGGPRMSARLVLGPGGVQLQHPTLAKSKVSFPEHPEFEKRWTLKAADAAAVRQVFTPPALDGFAALDDRGLHVEKGGDWLFFYRDTGLVQPAKYPAFLAQAERLLAPLALR